MVQLSSRDVAFSHQLGPLHGRFTIGEYLGDGEKDAFALVSWWAGFYPGGAANA